MPNILLKRIGVGLLLIPLGFLLLFTVGEIFSGDLSGLSHLIQAAPVLFLIILSIKKPFMAGLFLLIIGLVLGILYPFRVPFEIQTILLVEIILFLPPVISGVLLILSAKKK
jgi:hypothetical protein